MYDIYYFTNSMQLSFLQYSVLEVEQMPRMIKSTKQVRSFLSTNVDTLLFFFLNRKLSEMTPCIA